jgi:hypothetical protein
MEQADVEVKLQVLFGRCSVQITVEVKLYAILTSAVDEIGGRSGTAGVPLRVLLVGD